MPDMIREPWPWYIAGPLIGLAVPALLLLGNRLFGASSSLRHICAAALNAARLTSPRTTRTRRGRVLDDPARDDR